ncbi:reverse transcriptase, partial [Phytophthora megakarya]
MSEYMPDLTVNETEYRGLILCFDLLSTLDMGRGRVVICGDSNFIIRQMQGDMDCKAPGLQLLRQKALNRLRANKLASAALQREEGEIVPSEDGRQDLITLNRLGEMLKPKLIETVVSVNAITRAAERQRHTLKAMEESIIQRIRYQRIRQGGLGKLRMKRNLDGEVNVLTAEWTKACSKIAANYEVDENGLLFFCPKTLQQGEDRDGVVRVVIPDSLQRDFLHHYHASLEGGHQGVGRTESQRAREKHQETSRVHIPSYQVISMDHIPSLPKSFKGNTELLIWADLFTGYVIAKAGPSREAQAVAENYEEC